MLTYLQTQAARHQLCLCSRESSPAPSNQKPYHNLTQYWACTNILSGSSKRGPVPPGEKSGHQDNYSIKDTAPRQPSSGGLARASMLLPAQEAEAVGGGPRRVSSGLLRATIASGLLACTCLLSCSRLVSGQLTALVHSPTLVRGKHTSTPVSSNLHCIKYSIAFPEQDLHLDLWN